MKYTGVWAATILFAVSATAQVAFAEGLPPLKIGLMLPYKGFWITSEMVETNI